LNDNARNANTVAIKHLFAQAHLKVQPASSAANVGFPADISPQVAEGFQIERFATLPLRSWEGAEDASDRSAPSFCNYRIESQ